MVLNEQRNLDRKTCFQRRILQRRRRRVALDRLFALNDLEVHLIRKNDPEHFAVVHHDVDVVIRLEKLHLPG